jgi:membrane protein DedA with SNARE-associated domain
VNWWDRISGFMLGLIDQYDDQVIFVLVLLEEMGIPLPTPGDLVMLLAGSRAAQGKMHLLWALFLIQAATMIGASILFWMAARGGRPLLYRYGRYIGLDRARLDQAESLIARGPARAVFIGRLTPGLRNVSVLAAGVFGVRYAVFLPPFAAASFLYILVIVLLGYFFGPAALQAIAGPRLSLRLLLTVVVFVGLGVFLGVMYRRAARVRALERMPATEARRLETTLLAGLVATLQMAAGVSLALYLLDLFGLPLPEVALMRFFEGAAAQVGGGSTVRFVAFLLVLVLLTNLIWAVVYTHGVVRRLPHVHAWLRGLLFAPLPLLVSVLVVMPALGAGPLGLGLGAGLAPLAGELFRNVLYCVGLAIAYSLFRVARQPPARAEELAPAAASALGSGPP